MTSEAGRPLDEEYDTMRDVEQDPYGAWKAIQEQAAKIEWLRAEIEALKNPPDEYCAKCGAPKSNHPYRHPFVARAALGKEG